MTGNAAIKLQFLVSMNSSSDILFQPIKLGEIELQNRIVMASMSRARTENPELVPILCRLTITANVHRLG